MWSRRILAGLAASVVVAVGACGGVGPSSSPSPATAESRTETFEEAGVVVSLALDRTTVEAGGVIHARATVRNDGPGLVAWADLGYCDTYLFDREAPAVSPPPPGATWPGILGVVKSRFEPWPLGATGFRPPQALEDDVRCTGDDQRAAELQPDGSMTIDMVWPALMTYRLPAPPGAYRAIFQFPFLGRMAADQFDGDLVSDMSWIRVSVPFEVVGEAFSGIAPTLAVDRALEDDRVSAWLEAQQPDDIWRTGIALVDGDWLFIVDTRNGELRTEIDPTDGSIIGVEIAE